MRARTVALLFLVSAFVALIGPTSAFDQATFSRSASATIVTHANGYNGITVNACNILRVTGGTCGAITVTNKATTVQYYTVSEDPNSLEVTRYKIDSSAWQTIGRITTPSTVAVGASSTVTLDVAACAACPDKSAYYTVEGEKANSLNSMQTKILVTINYT